MGQPGIRLPAAGRPHPEPRRDGPGRGGLRARDAHGRDRGAQTELAAATGSLINLVREDYPELGATDAFRDLQVQLEGTENRINTQRRDYNAVVADYNQSVRTFPNNLIAGITGFGRKVPFEAEAGAENAPDVSFD